MYYSFLIHSFTDGHLGHFQCVAVINIAAMNIGVHRFYVDVFNTCMWLCCSCSYPLMKQRVFLILLNDWQLSEGRVVEGTGWKKVKGLTKKNHLYITHRHRQECGDSHRERGLGVGGCGQREDKGNRKRLSSGRWAHDAECGWCFVSLYAWNLCGFGNQSHPSKVLF